MNNRREHVGISQRVRVEWLEATVNLLLAGNGHAATAAALNEMLAPELSVNSNAARGSRQKTITILTKTWCAVPPGLESLRDAGLALHPTLDANHRHALHWGMSLAAYPFWGAVAAQTGRLLRLQGTAAAAQVQRRTRERYGERPTVSRATARVLRSYIDWGVLQDTDAKGVYTGHMPRKLDNTDAAAWLAEAMLRTLGSAAANPARLLAHPALFPYRVPHLSASRLAARSRRLEAARQGLDEDVLMLRAWQEEPCNR